MLKQQTKENTPSCAASELNDGLGAWLPIETAPKGYPSLEEPSEWFLAYGSKYTGPKGGEIAVIRRVFGHGFGPWECTGDAYYRADFFSHWMPLPEAPNAKVTGVPGFIGTSG